MDVGRVCVKIVGREAGRKCVVVSTIDDNFVLVDSPEVRRRRCNVRHLKPTEERIDLTEGASTGDVEKALKKASMIFYLQSLCPVTAPPDRDLPPLIHLLISPTSPATAAHAILCIGLLTLLVLVLAGCLARRLEINYSTD